MASTGSAGTDEDPTPGLTTHFSEAGRIPFSAGSVEATLHQVVGLAVATIEGCDYAGLFLAGRDIITNPIHTDPVVAELDTLQHHTGEGPCVDAVASAVTVYAEDLADDLRWPHFGPEATAMGVRSVLAFPLLANGTIGTLNLYGRYPKAFGVIDRARGLLLAGLAAGVVSSAQTHDDGERREANLHAALASREVIGQAEGILMERERITADQAFDILRRASQHLNVKLREVAQTLVDTGERPDTGKPRSG
jgi:hypothetical protein